MSTQQQLDFDRVTFSAPVAEKAKVQGMQSAALSKKEVLELAREACRIAARRRQDRTATADDAQEFLIGSKLELGNAAGSLFLGKEWEFTGEWRPSRRVSNHNHKNRVWRLK